MKIPYVAILLCLPTIPSAAFAQAPAPVPASVPAPIFRVPYGPVLVPPVVPVDSSSVQPPPQYLPQYAPDYGLPNAPMPQCCCPPLYQRHNPYGGQSSHIGFFVGLALTLYLILVFAVPY